jgi:hypothetical protein
MAANKRFQPTRSASLRGRLKREPLGRYIAIAESTMNWIYRIKEGENEQGR